MKTILVIVFISIILICVISVLLISFSDDTPLENFKRKLRFRESFIKQMNKNNEVEKTIDEFLKFIKICNELKHESYVYHYDICSCYQSLFVFDGKKFFIIVFSRNYINKDDIEFVSKNINKIYDKKYCLTLDDFDCMFNEIKNDEEIERKQKDMKNMINELRNKEKISNSNDIYYK